MKEQTLLGDVQYYTSADSASWTIDDPGTLPFKDHPHSSRVISTVALCEKSGRTRTMTEMLKGLQQTYSIRVVTLGLVDVMTEHGADLPYRHPKPRVVFQTEVAADTAKVALLAFRSAITQRPSGAK